MTDLLTLQTRLIEAESAHHRLMTGSMEELIENNGRKAKFMLSDAPQLLSYISMLRKQIAALQDIPGSRRRRALTVTL